MEQNNELSESEVEHEDDLQKQQEPVESEVQKLENELSDYKDKYFRALAEIENTRKRLQREKIESHSFAIQNVILDFLQPIDHFENALKASEHAQNEVKQWAIGFEMILAQLKQVLADNDIHAFVSVGRSFDPHMHDAIETEETLDVAEGIVMQEFLRGYKMGNRVIRPARVKVATKPKENNENSES